MMSNFASEAAKKSSLPLPFFNNRSANFIMLKKPTMLMMEPSREIIL